ncbi:MAG: MaoC family dehydratase [Thermodesulfobacteriota bacterium]
MIEILPVAKIKEKVGAVLGVSDWIQITQDRVNAFAECTEDRQWIHVDIEQAKKGPFGGPIAHGFLVLSMVPFFSAQIGVIPEGAIMAVNYGLNKVRFVNPVKVGSRIRDNVTLSAVEEKEGKRVLITSTHTIEIENETKPAAIAEMLAMFMTV